MHEAFLNFLRSNELIKEGERTLIAVSGGIDSVALTDLLSKSEFLIALAHCNFQLRGEESNEDEQFVKSLGTKLGIPVFTRRFQTRELADKSGISIQMAARKLRYRWLEELADKERYNKIAFAHHKDDQLETILFNLSRGTGIAGLTGMQPLNGNIIRPLLFADRNMIEQYARLNELDWREDSSNESTKYTRNLIRHKVTPVLKEINPGLLETLDFTLLRLMETESVLNERLLRFVREEVRIKDEDIFISIASLESSLSPTLALHAVVSPFGFSYHQCVNILDSIGHVGNLFYSKKAVINVDRSDLILTLLKDKNFQSTIVELDPDATRIDLKEGILAISKLDKIKLNIKNPPSVAFLDFDKLKFPLKVRHWASGDWFIPLGMKGKKKISDLMIDEKIPLNLKNRVMILESAGDIVWVIGHRMDERYKITPETTSVWKIKYEKD